ncbi:MAG: hypothetical protein AAGE18_11195 [Pseudomonadota bacterium]
MTIFALLAGIVIAVGVFGATLWSFAQILLARGALRWTHGLSLLATIAGMAAITLVSPPAALAAGAALVLSAAVAGWLERRWTRLLPILQIVFGLALATGLPFAER